MSSSIPLTGTEGVEPEQQHQSVIYFTIILASFAFATTVINPLIDKVLRNKIRGVKIEKAQGNKTAKTPPRSPDEVHRFNTKKHSRRQPPVATSLHYPQNSTTPTPTTTAKKKDKMVSHRYGLVADEVAEVFEDENNDELSATELRRLYASPAFKKWCTEKHITSDDLEKTSQRLQLYRTLRKLHPASFWELCVATSRRGIESSPLSKTALTLEYITSMALTLLAAAMIISCYTQQLNPLAVTVLILSAWHLTFRQWLSSKPTISSLGINSLWYEDPIWGHAVRSWRSVLANLLELFYIVGTLGTGAVVSIVMRVMAKDSQCVGERLAGVRVVREKVVRLDID